MKIKFKRTLSAPFLVLICYGLLILSSLISESELKYRDNIYLSVIVIQILIFIIPGIIYCKVGGISIRSGLKIKRFGFNKALFAVFSVCALISLSGLIKLGLYELGYSSQTYSLYSQYIPTATTGIRDILYIVLAIAVLPASTEEFIFRGILISEYRKSNCNINYSIAFSSLLFAMLHFSLGQLPVYFAGGIAFALIFFVTDSLPCAIIAHILNNAFSLLFETSILRIINQSNSIIFVLFIFFGTFLVFFIFALHFAEKIFMSRALSGETTEKPKALSKKKRKGISPELEALISPSFLACIALFLLRVFKVIKI